MLGPVLRLPVVGLATRITIFELHRVSIQTIAVPPCSNWQPAADAPNGAPRDVSDPVVVSIWKPSMGPCSFVVTTVPMVYTNFPFGEIAKSKGADEVRNGEPITSVGTPVVVFIEKTRMC